MVNSNLDGSGWKAVIIKNKIKKKFKLKKKRKRRDSSFSFADLLQGRG